LVKRNKLVKNKGPAPSWEEKSSNCGVGIFSKKPEKILVPFPVR